MRVGDKEDKEDKGDKGDKGDKANLELFSSLLPTPYSLLTVKISYCGSELRKAQLNLTKGNP
ncbi:hypothetical protein B7486_42915 [cyanobacterium TDX16]|nr:hypothetical protein B7486_42915 [cyanobacterium TDX16]